MKSQFKNLDKFQIVGFLISATVAFIFLFSQQDKVTGVILGFVMAALTQLFDLQKRSADTEERILNSSALSQILYRDEWLLEHVQQIVKDYQAVKGSWFSLFKQRGDDAVIECRNVLHSMAEGHLMMRSGRTGAGNPETIAMAKKNVKAVAAIDEAFWRTPEGDIWIRANAKALDQGVKIIRVFTYPIATLRGMTDILEHQQKMGIEVYVAPAETIPGALNEDYVLLDDRIVMRTEQTAQQERISIEKVEVEQKVKQFETLLRYAKRPEEMMSTLRGQ